MSFRFLMLAGALAAVCASGGAPAPGRLLAASAPGDVRIGEGTRHVRLLPACGPDGRAVDIGARIAAAPRRRILLVIEDLRARGQPGVLFDLKLASGRATGRRTHAAAIGTLNFFAAQKPGAAARPRAVSYDVTRTQRGLAAEGRLGGDLFVVIQPAGAPAPGADASVGRIALVAQ
jgi:hypothetical protein